MGEVGGKPWRCHDSEYARHSERCFANHPFAIPFLPMEMGSGKRVVAGLLSAIVPGSGQILKKEMKKAILYLAVLAFLLFLTWTTTLYDTLVGLVVLKIGVIGLALIASLDAFLTGAASKPRHLVLVPILAALFLGDALS